MLPLYRELTDSELMDIMIYFPVIPEVRLVDTRYFLYFEPVTEYEDRIERIERELRLYLILKFRRGS